jgi:acetyl esterase/lipase
MMDGQYRSLHLVAADLLPMIEQLSKRDRSLPLAQRRRETIEMLAKSCGSARDVRRSEKFIQGPNGEIRLLVYQPEFARPQVGAFLHLHGGGFVLGAPELGDERNTQITRELGHVVASVAYRLAPEATYPAALEDAYAALLWLARNASALNIDPKRIGIVGESAGGGHAAALALASRDRGEVPLSLQWLIYPMLDDRTGSVVDPHPFAGEFVWTASDNQAAWKAMLGQDAGGIPPGPYAVPARVEDLSGLPPTLIQTGALDLFCEENIDYARRLIRAGVSTELHVYPNAPHGFTLVSDSLVARAARRDAFDVIRRIWG